MAYLMLLNIKALLSRESIFFGLRALRDWRKELKVLFEVMCEDVEVSISANTTRR